MKSHTVVTVKKDGSATIEEKTTLSGMVAQMLQGFGGLGQNPAGQPAGQGGALQIFKKKDFEDRAKKMGEGVRLASFKEVKDPQGGMGVHVEYSVKDGLFFEHRRRRESKH